MNSDYLYDMAETCFGTAWTGSTLKIDPLLIKVLKHYNVEIGKTIVGHDTDLKTFTTITHLHCEIAMTLAINKLSVPLLTPIRIVCGKLTINNGICIVTEINKVITTFNTHQNRK